MPAQAASTCSPTAAAAGSSASATTARGCRLTTSRSRSIAMPPRSLPTTISWQSTRLVSAAKHCLRSAPSHALPSPRGTKASRTPGRSRSTPAPSRNSNLPRSVRVRGSRCRDLFYATPARLKFLRLDRTEAEAVRDTVRRLAMSRPDVAFTLAGEERAPVTFAATLPGATGRLARLGDVLGADFRANAVAVAGEREGVVVEGFAALPTLTRQCARPISVRQRAAGARRKLLLGAVRAAYADYLPRDRHPLLALFVSVPPREVDVNVHPAKAEVRFRNAGLVRALIVHALKEALARDGSARGDDRRKARRSRALRLPGSYSLFRAQPQRDVGLAAFAGLAGRAIHARFSRGAARGRLCRSGAGRFRRRHARGRSRRCRSRRGTRRRCPRLIRSGRHARRCMTPI